MIGISANSETLTELASLYENGDEDTRAAVLEAYLIAGDILRRLGYFGCPIRVLWPPHSTTPPQLTRGSDCDARSESTTPKSLSCWQCQV